MRIYKYTLAIKDRQTVQMITGAQILTAQMQGEALRLWAIVDESVHTVEPRTFGVYGTGHQLPTDFGKYIATFQAYDGGFVGHVFELSS